MLITLLLSNHKINLDYLIHMHYMSRFSAVDVSSGDQYLWAFCSSVVTFFLLVLLSSATAFMFSRQPSPTGYHNYQMYTMENTRQTILNDYITSQQMQVIRPDMARGLSPREQPVAIPYPAGTRGMALH